ncbi:MAG: amino acid--[acyl-carrier-protein] ligase, partial [Bradyrhizobium sp.]
MNIAIQAASPELAPQSPDPLDHLADVLFHKMGSDGVYARTALYEDVVERLAALIGRHREPNTEVMRFPPVMS